MELGLDFRQYKYLKQLLRQILKMEEKTFLTSPSTRSYRFYNPRTLGSMVRPTKLFVLRRHDEGLRDKIEMLCPFRMLHTFYVLVQPILSCQFVWSREVVDPLMGSQCPQHSWNMRKGTMKWKYSVCTFPRLVWDANRSRGGWNRMNYWRLPWCRDNPTT